jgi:RimJ/RimL family protein N-acetyltransferase
VGSELLYRCRHLGPYHADFLSLLLNDPASLTLLVQPAEGPDAPVGFVRLYGIHLLEQFAFLETAVSPEWTRKGWGIEASRVFLAFALDVFGLRRVEAKVYGYNRLSVNALRRNGFRQEGVLRQACVHDGSAFDILVFAILHDEMVEQRRRDGFPPMGLWDG